jgi:cytochrome c oxidase subunit 2
MFQQPLLDANEPASSTLQLPVAMSTGADAIDWLYYFIYWFSVVFTVGITAATLYFVWKYRRRKGVSAAPTQENTALELSWTVPPVLLIVWMFHVSYSAYIRNAVAADNALEIRVRGARWNWSYQYPDGTPESGDALYLPVNKPVKMVMSSSDVLHDYFVPAFRLKKDVVPGMYSQIAFTPNRLGEAQVFCAEYCGAGAGPTAGGHFSMLSKIKIVTEAEYEEHLKKIKDIPAELKDKENGTALWGEQLYKGKGCTTCHSVDGSAGTGPTFKGVWGRTESLTTGEQVKVDENYVRESILRPQAKIVKTFENGNMPPFVFTDKQIDAIIAYLKTTK